MEPLRDTFSAPDGAPLHRDRWLPEGHPRGQVVYAHGYADHPGRYRNLFEDLVGRGLAVHALDQAGHGRSPGRPGQVLDARAWVDSLVALLEELQAEVGPVALIGHSFGAAACARAAQLRPDLIDALVLLAPFVRSGLGYAGWLLRVVDVLARALPAWPTAPVDPEVVSRNPEEVAAYRHDPLVFHGRVPLAAARELHALGPRVLADAERLVTPVLVLQGSADRLSAPDGSRSLYERAAASDRTLREVEGGYHDLLHDLDAERVRAGLVAWLEERLA